MPGGGERGHGAGSRVAVLGMKVKELPGRSERGAAQLPIPVALRGVLGRLRAVGESRAARGSLRG